MRKNDGAVPVEGRVLVTELSGSESVVHFEVNDTFHGRLVRRATKTTGLLINDRRLG